MSPPPATPPPPEHAREPSSALWASPQFSDYFSDAGDFSADRTRKDRNGGRIGAGSGGPVQSRILSRLDAIAKKVAHLHENDGSQTPALLDFDAELSALEARLNAPESQTREIAEAGSDLFADDEEAESAILMEENEGLRREVREGRDVIARVTKLRESLQGHYDEMKNNFQLASERLTSTAEENSRLRTTVTTLESDNENLRDHNTRLHADLETAIPTIFRLKGQLDTLQSQVSENYDNNNLEESISQLQHEWADVDHDFQDIYRRYRKPGNGRTDSVMGKGNTPPMEKGSVEGSEDEDSERMHRSRIIIKRGGIVRRIDAEPSSESASEDEGVMGETLVGELEDEGPKDGVEAKPEAGAADVRDGTVEQEENPLQDHGEVASTVPDTPRDEPKTSTTAKTKRSPDDLTPWQELCASIADFAGWHDAYES